MPRKITDNAFRANTFHTSETAITTPASAGPMDRPTLIDTISNRVAAATSSRGTSSGITDCQVGCSTAPPTPRAKVKISSSAGVACPSAVSTASDPATRKTYTCTVNISHRRSKTSASTPAGSANSMIGKVAAVWTSATVAPALGWSTSAHWTPTVCIHTPRYVTSTAGHSQRNQGCRSGANGDVDDVISTATLVDSIGLSLRPYRPADPQSVQSRLDRTVDVGPVAS